MTKQEYNKDFWCVYDSPSTGRIIVSYSRLVEMLGSYIYVVFRKLAQNKNQKLIIRPFHHQTYIFYRH